MLITIDKRGSINLPAVLREKLRLNPGSYLKLTVQEGGTIMLQPVSIFPTIRLNEQGLEKLREARESGTGKLPNWIVEDMNRAKNFLKTLKSSAPPRACGKKLPRLWSIWKITPFVPDCTSNGLVMTRLHGPFGLIENQLNRKNI